MKMAFNKDAYQELCNHIQELNNFLANVTQSSLRIADARRQKGRAGSKYSARLKRLRHDASNMHRTVTSKACWKCTCQHKVMLKMRPGFKDVELFPGLWRLGVNEPMAENNSWHLLELQPQAEIGKEDQPSSQFQKVSGHAFHIENDAISGTQSGGGSSSFSRLKDRTRKSVRWQAPGDPPSIAVVQVQMAGLRLTNVRIEDICTAIRASSTHDLGFLEATDNTWTCNVIYKSRGHQNASTLGQLLQQNSEQSSAAYNVFSRRERLAAAATLAFSVLFLDGSWLKPVWTSDDVLFVRNAATTTDHFGTDHAVDELAFSWIVCSSEATDADTEQKCQILKTQRKTAVLFALAMALIELSLGKPLETMKSEEERLADYVSGNVAAATRLLPKVHDTSGFEYSEVVRKCLDCPFDVRERTMNNETFLSICFEQIAQPLIHDYEGFVGSQ